MSIFFYNFFKQINIKFNSQTLYLALTYVLVGFFFDWQSCYMFGIFNLVACLFLYNYVTVLGLVKLSLLSTSLVMVKSWVSFYTNVFQCNNKQFWYFGSYSKVTDNFTVNLTLVNDIYNLSYITLTLSIGTWAILYAYNYMKDEPRVFNFIWLLLSFLYSMVFLLASYSFSSILLGWELIGSFSFLLINFWTTRISTFKSALKAFFFNKLSDVCLLIVLILLSFYINTDTTENLTNIVYLVNVKLYFIGLEFNASDLILFFLSICCFCKSAQFGFHTWLPDSMEAPVPASALIHSATLVSAGIYLFGRIPNYIIFDFFWNYIMIISSLTAFYGGLVAAYQTDLKRILAYSTISHCGFLFFILTLDNFFILVLYLHLHGWFKSLSFMCSGNIIGFSNNYQDYRRMGRLSNSNAFEYIILVASILNLSSIPFLIGFFNKHFLLCVFNNFNITLIPAIFVILASFTGVFYGIKFLYGVFYSSDKRHYSLKSSDHVLYPSSSTWTSSTGITPATVLTLISLISTIIASAVLFILFSKNGDLFNLTLSVYGYVNMLFYANIYMFIAASVLFFKNKKYSYFLLFFLLLKVIYTCL